MFNYPKNRIYTVMTMKAAKKFLGELTETARKSLDGNYLVWDFSQNNPVLETLKSEPGVVLYSHDEILPIMSGAFWSLLENKIYAVMTMKVAKKFLGELTETARKSLDGNYLIFDFPLNDPVLETFKSEPGVVLYNHDEILAIMSNEFWSRPLNF